MSEQDSRIQNLEEVMQDVPALNGTGDQQEHKTIGGLKLAETPVVPVAEQQVIEDASVKRTGEPPISSPLRKKGRRERMKSPFATLLGNKVEQALAEVKPDPSLIRVAADDPIEGVLVKMHHEKVTGVAVQGTSEDYRPFLGFVNVLDIVYYLCLRTALPTDELDRYQFSHGTIRELLDTENRTTESMGQVRPTDKVETAARLFSSPYVRRLLVTDRAQTQMDVISPLDVVKYVLRHREELDGVLLQTLDTIGIRRDRRFRLLRMGADESALSGFRRMAENDVTALPVVDTETGSIVGTLSATDLCGVTWKDMNMIKLPVLNFLKSRGNLVEPICVLSTDTLGDCMEKMAGGSIHRVWVVEDHQRKIPFSVLSVSDCMRLMVAPPR
jgi:CBS domain-containing protein